jgi:hypothetical protein
MTYGNLDRKHLPRKIEWEDYGKIGEPRLVEPRKPPDEEGNQGCRSSEILKRKNNRFGLYSEAVARCSFTDARAGRRPWTSRN